jgi:HEAT repeat protein
MSEAVHRNLRRVLLVIMSLAMAWAGRLLVNAQNPIDGIDARANTAELGRQLSSPDPLVRQRSAEALARLAAVDQIKMVQGYRLEEKNKEVRLALDWALYRMGKSESLYRIVHELNSGRQLQAIGYLSQLESPDLLYPFLKNETNPRRVNAGLIKALARIGDATTLDQIRPFRESFQSGVAEAAESAYDEIEKRLGQDTPATSSRPRTVEKPEPNRD